MSRRRRSRASRRTIALDARSVQELQRHAREQRAEAAAALREGREWHDSGYVFTRRDGQPLNRNTVAYWFRRHLARSGLPPIRLHDLRHGAATLAHAAGADLKTVQDQLGHASMILTAATCTSVLDTRQHQAAAATARLVLDTTRRAANQIRHRETPAHWTENSPVPTIPTTGRLGIPIGARPRHGL